MYLLKFQNKTHLIAAATLVSLLAFASTLFFPVKNVDKNLSPEKPPPQSTVLITKETYEKMVQDGADKRYIQDVLGAKSVAKLPVPKTKMPLQPYPYSLNSNLSSNTANQMSKAALQASSKDITHTTNMAAIADNQHCPYKGDNYSLGEIVQIDKGWMRCTPTITISADGSSNYGQAVWTLRDSLM